MLIQHGADINARANDGTTPLHIVIRMRACLPGLLPPRVSRMVAFLIFSSGADVNCKALNGLTPLHEAIWYDDKNLVRMLLEGGARTDIPNACGQTPMDFAAAHPKLLTLLQRNGQSLDLRQHNAIPSMVRSAAIAIPLATRE